MQKAPAKNGDTNPSANVRGSQSSQRTGTRLGSVTDEGCFRPSARPARPVTEHLIEQSMQRAAWLIIGSNGGREVAA